MSRDSQRNSLITESKTTTRHGENKLLYDHTQFNEAIEILIKKLDRFDRFHRAFAQ